MYVIVHSPRSSLKREMPKSAILMFPSESRSTFAEVRSRWMICGTCACK